ncbi:MAG: 6-carboxytetrahydropterin synthase QueD [Bacteroidetes bacterium GWF2_33_16]|nr:MAG: 6-carboxytetrahydropterin synthase QueD [Bacteroidetes bacterium GWE2_32_14]OFY03452.1 MAG: 6-carboxytetrahydropterin synthase QueD [Bacteroidetes bacterium GWF2_33_16]
MTKIRVTKEFNFEIAHALWNYNGPCANIHGHSYKLFVTVIGSPIVDEKNPKLGMVIDFGDLKKIINDEIIKPLDHAFIISKSASESLNCSQNQMFEKQSIVDYQPTCENMVIDFVQKIKKKLPSEVKLYSLKLHETATSFAEWFASDNN